MKLKTAIILTVSALAVWLFLRWLKKENADNARRGLQWSFLGS
jgi:hypothetical protein